MTSRHGAPRRMSEHDVSVPTLAGPSSAIRIHPLALSHTDFVSARLIAEYGCRMLKNCNLLIYNNNLHLRDISPPRVVAALNRLSSLLNDG